MIFDINRIVVLVLICALLYALYMYQQQISFPSIPFLNNKVEATEVSKQTKVINNKEEDDNNKIKKSKHKTPIIKKRDKTDLISIDNMSQISLGSLVDYNESIEDNIKNKRKSTYKKALDTNSLETGNTLGSIIEGTENEDFFFQ